MAVIPDSGQRPRSTTGWRGRVSGAGASLTWRVLRWPPRSTVSGAVPARPLVAKRKPNASGSSIVTPSTARITSPVFRPASAAGPFSITEATSAPVGRSSFSPSTRSDETVCSLAPNHGRFTALLPLLADAMTILTMLTGMAKPMPWLPPDCEKIAVLTPISRPSMSTSAPPELPGLMAASVWMKNW